MTAFAHAVVPLWEDLAFHLDGNGKITCDDGSFDAPVANAFSLPHIATCPGSTPECRAGCYAGGIPADVYRWYAENERVLHRVLMHPHAAGRAARKLANHLTDTVARFRWHVSGDVFSARYAAWICQVCEYSPGVRHWIYTRSHHLVPHLTPVDNLTVNVSADASNLASALDTAKALGLRVCYYAREGETLPQLPPGSVIFPDYPLRGRDLPTPTDHPWWQALDTSTRRAVCPADFFGQSPAHRCGPCSKCL